MAADNNLANQALENIELMEKAVQPKGLKVIVQVDLPNTGTRRYEIRHHPSAGIGSPVVQHLGETDSGSSQTLSDFINWGFATYPAERKMLIIWSHADSWYKNAKWIAPDNSSQNLIGVANGELKQALDNAIRPDILLFDACSMQSIEILYELKECADIIIGSSEEAPIIGFPYDAMIPLMNGSPRAFAEKVPELYKESYLPGTPNNPYNHFYDSTCSAVDTDYLESFFQLFKAYSEGLRPYASVFSAINDKLYRFNTGEADIDLKQLLFSLSKADILRDQTDELLELLSQISIAEAHTHRYYQANYGSIALWAPKTRFNFLGGVSTYMCLSFPKSGWGSLLNLALGSDDEPPLSPILSKQYQRLGKVYLKVKAPLDCDSLYYHLEYDDSELFITPPAFAEEFTLSFPMNKLGGSFSLTAIDRAGNVSLPLEGNYHYKKPKAEISLYPNPISDAHLATVEWYLQSDKPTKFSIYNIKGQKVLSYARDFMNQKPAMLYLSEIEGFESLKAGLYILQIESSNEQLFKKFIIHH